MRYKFFIFLFFLLIILNFFAKSVYSVTTTISNLPPSITSDDFTVDVTVTGASAGTNYLRIDLYKPDTTNYFGETFNGTEWYGHSDFLKYYPIEIQSGTDWSGKIKGRVGNPNATQYIGPGTYKIRLRRYTGSGNYASTEANNSISDVTIDITLPTIIPSNSPIPSETITPSETPNPTPTAQSYSNLYISEVMIDPENDSNEWVELYNGNDFITVLNNWYIDDVDSAGTTPKKLSLNIDSNRYGIVEFTSSVFNNDGDSIRLLDFNQKEIDSIQYTNSEKGKTLGRISIDNDTFCTQQPSYGTANNQCLYPTSSPTSKPTNSSTPTQVSNPTITDSAISHVVLSNRAVLPTNFFPFVQNQIVITPVIAGIDKKVLGIATQNKSNRDLTKHAVTLSLSFASFGYSSLAGCSILLKIKKNTST